MRVLLNTALAITTALALSSCDAGDQGKTLSDLLNTGTAPVPTGPLVCGDTAISSANGLVATLKYLPSTSYNFDYNGSSDPSVCTYSNPTASGCPDGLNLDYAYMDANGTASDAIFYVPALGVVPQEFTEGFPTVDGHKVTDNSGNVLTSYFSMDFYSEIQLTADQPAGYYQFSTISDDGSILSLDLQGNGTFTPIVQNDFWHGPIMQCATQAVYLTPGVPMPIQVQYFQGPPVGIAMMVLWRQVSSATPPSDPYCGASNIPVSNNKPDLSSALYCSGAKCANLGGPDYYTVTNTSSVPTDLFTDLENSSSLTTDTGASNWSVVAAANYFLPVNSAPNPCVGSTGSGGSTSGGGGTTPCTGPFCGGGGLGN